MFLDRKKRCANPRCRSWFHGSEDQRLCIDCWSVMPAAGLKENYLPLTLNSMETLAARMQELYSEMYDDAPAKSPLIVIACCLRRHYPGRAKAALDKNRERVAQVPGLLLFLDRHLGSYGMEEEDAA